MRNAAIKRRTPDEPIGTDRDHRTLFVIGQNRVWMATPGISQQFAGFCVFGRSVGDSRLERRVGEPMLSNWRRNRDPRSRTPDHSLKSRCRKPLIPSIHRVEVPEHFTKRKGSFPAIFHAARHILLRR
jgi:hypothetical protein